ncbi:Retrovirus-related Pol polyprotein, partial [Mucuna pruriens]
MEFCDNMVQFNIFEAMKRPTKNHSVFVYFECTCEGGMEYPICAKVAEVAPSEPPLPSTMQPPALEPKPLLEHLKYAYLEDDQKASSHYSQQPPISARGEHKKAIGWTLADLPRINLSICVHRILLEEEARPMRRLNPTILDVIKKEVMKLHAVSPILVVPTKPRMTVVKNQNDELLPTIIQNSWQVCIDYRKLNQATRKDHFPLPFIDQVLERWQGTCRFILHHKTTFTYSFGTFSYTRMPFNLCNALRTFQRCMISIFFELLENCMKLLMDDFTVYGHSFNACLESLSKVLDRCIETNLVLNFEKFHFIITKGIVLRHLVSNRGIGDDKDKIDIIAFLSHLTSVREAVEFFFDQPCIEAFQELKKRDIPPLPSFKHQTGSFLFELMCDASNLALRAKLLAFDFALDKFCSSLLDSKIVVFSDHAALNFLLKKPNHMQLDGINPWFANIVNYLVASILSHEESRSYKDKIKCDAKYYVWVDPYLWKFCSGQVIRMCIPNHKISNFVILHQ